MSFAANFSSMNTLSPIKPAKMITWQAALPSNSDKAVRLYETIGRYDFMRLDSVNVIIIADRFFEEGHKSE